MAVAPRSLPAGRHARVRRPPPDGDARRRGDLHGGVRHAGALPRGGAVARARLHRTGAAPGQAQRLAAARVRHSGRPLVSCLPSAVARRRRRGRSPSARGWRTPSGGTRTEQGTWVAANRALQAEDARGHGRRRRWSTTSGGCGRTRRPATQRHFSLHGPDMMPIGLLLARAEDWGLGPEVVLPTLAGCVTGLDRAAARCSMRCGRPSPRPAPSPPRSRSCARSRARSSTPSWTSTGGDWSRATTSTRWPSSSCRRWWPTSPVPAGDEPVDVAPAGEAAARGGAGRWSATLIGPSSLGWSAMPGPRLGLRDDNGAVTAAWPAGLLRRAMLAAGRVLVDRGALSCTEHAVEVTVDELVELLEGRSPLDAEAIAARAVAAGRTIRAGAAAPARTDASTSPSTPCRRPCGPSPEPSSRSARCRPHPSAPARGSTVMASAMPCTGAVRASRPIQATRWTVWRPATSSSPSGRRRPTTWRSRSSGPWSWRRAGCCRTPRSSRASSG